VTFQPGLEPTAALEDARRAVLEAASRYYDLKFAPGEPFTPGETYVRYAGRVFDVQEVLHLMDASMDMWLTAGRFANRLEKGLAKFYGLRHASLVRLDERVRDRIVAETRGNPLALLELPRGLSAAALAGGFEFALSCDLRIAEDGDYLIGLPEAQLGLLPGAGGTQRLPRTIGMPAALMHILMGVPLAPRDAEKKGLVHETVGGKALDRAMDIARRLSRHTPASLAYIKRLVRNATETPLAQGLALERNLFLKLCISDAGLARMRSYEAANITSPARSIEVDERKVKRG